VRRLLLSLVLISVLVLALTACKQESGYDVDINEVHNQIKETLGDDYYPQRKLEQDEFENLTGITEDLISEIIAEGPAFTMNVDTFIAIKATDGNSEEVANKLEDYRVYLIEESFQYPMNMPKVNSAKVLHFDDYVFFLMLGKHNDNMDTSEESALEFAQNEVSRVEDIIIEFFS